MNRNSFLTELKRRHVYNVAVERNFVAGRGEMQRARALDPLYTWPLMFEC